jgi:ribosomal protein L40E
MEQHLCPRCGAPLPIAAPGAVERCRFCATESRLEPAPIAAPPPAPPATPDMPAAPAQNTGIGCNAIVALGGVAIGLFAIGAAIVGSCKSASSSDSAAAAPTATQAPKPKVTLANLATTPIDQWQEIDAPGMVGRYEAFDAVANMEWAKRIGAAWKADTILWMMNVRDVGKDGMVNLAVTPGASVTYYLVSPKCLTDYKNSTALVDPKTLCGIMVLLDAQTGTPGVRFGGEGVGISPALQDPTCTMTQAFAALEKEGKLPPRPVYNAMLGGSGSRRVWMFQTVISGQATIPVVDADTCKVAP